MEETQNAINIVQEITINRNKLKRVGLASTFSNDFVNPVFPLIPPTFSQRDLGTFPKINTRSLEK